MLLQNDLKCDSTTKRLLKKKKKAGLHGVSVISAWDVLSSQGKKVGMFGLGIFSS